MAKALKSSGPSAAKRKPAKVKAKAKTKLKPLKSKVVRRAAAALSGTTLSGAVLDRLHDVVLNRRSVDPALSHSARLLARGRAKVAQKFGEEAVEALIEGVTGDKAALIAESADVLYHLLLMWAACDVPPADVWAELERREGVSGIIEKSQPATTARRSYQKDPLMPVDACAPYDDSNVFARILRGELPHQTIFSDPWALAFADVAPLAPVHVLVIPTGRYVSLADFTIHASDQEIVGFWRAVGSVTHDLKLTRDGFRLVTNAGRDAGQEVPHMHVHLFAGGPLGPMLARL